MKSKPQPNTYGSLFAYLENHQQESRSTDPHFLTRRFLSEHHLKHDRIIEILEGFGGYDDGEVLLNVVEKIDRNTSLWAEVETPMEYALRNRLFLYTDDNGWSEPDLNLATLMMLEAKRG
jgi:hypothetical protein